MGFARSTTCSRSAQFSAKGPQNVQNPTEPQHWGGEVEQGTALGRTRNILTFLEFHRSKSNAFFHGCDRETGRRGRTGGVKTGTGL